MTAQDLWNSPTAAEFAAEVRRALPDGPQPDFGVYLVGRDPGPFGWDHRWVRWPDFRTPSSPDDAIAALTAAYARAENERVEVACGGGIGRTGTALAVIAILAGVERSEAVQWVRQHYHRRAIETHGNDAGSRESPTSPLSCPQRSPPPAPQPHLALNVDQSEHDQNETPPAMNSARVLHDGQGGGCGTPLRSVSSPLTGGISDLRSERRRLLRRLILPAVGAPLGPAARIPAVRTWTDAADSGPVISINTRSTGTNQKEKEQ